MFLSKSRLPHFVWGAPERSISSGSPLLQDYILPLRRNTDVVWLSECKRHQTGLELLQVTHLYTCTHTQTTAITQTWAGLTAAAQLPLLWCPPQANTTNQMKVMTKQKTETNITQPWGFSGTTSVHATRIHTRPPKICRKTRDKRTLSWHESTHSHLRTSIECSSGGLQCCSDVLLSVCCTLKLEFRTFVSLLWRSGFSSLSPSSLHKVQIMMKTSAVCGLNIKALNWSCSDVSGRCS